MTAQPNAKICLGVGAISHRLNDGQLRFPVFFAVRADSESIETQNDIPSDGSSALIAIKKRMSEGKSDDERGSLIDEVAALVMCSHLGPRNRTLQRATVAKQ
jgi:hypothetical protein